MVDINEIIKALDKEIIKKDKDYLTLRHANKLLLNKGLMTIKEKFDHSFKKALEERKIPNSKLIQEKPRHWIITLSEKGNEDYYNKHGIYYNDRHEKKLFGTNIKFSELTEKRQTWGVVVLLFIILFVYATYFSEKATYNRERYGTTKKSINSNYKDKELNGIHTTYYEEGIIEEKIEYKNGVKDGIYELYDYVPASKRHYKRIVGSYENGKENGLFRYYDYYYDVRTDRLGSKLILTATINYMDGLEHGQYDEYDPKEGFLLISTNYINGVEHGTRKSYCPKGRDKGKLYISQKVVRGQIQEGDYYCDCDF